MVQRLIVFFFVWNKAMFSSKIAVQRYVFLEQSNHFRAKRNATICCCLEQRNVWRIVVQRTFSDGSQKAMSSVETQCNDLLFLFLSEATFSGGSHCNDLLSFGAK